VNGAGDGRLDRLRGFYEVLSEPDPSPGDDDSDEVWNGWMNRVGADGDLAGLLHSALHGARYFPAELKEYREASDQFGSRLGPDAVEEAYRLLAQL
jgi:hypothetical protein